MAKRYKDEATTRANDPILPGEGHRLPGSPVPRERKSQKAQYPAANPGPRNDRVTKFHKKTGLV